MLRSILVKVVVSTVLFIGLVGCGIVKSERSEPPSTSPSLEPQASKTYEAVARTESAESLCAKLSEIKKIPYRDPKDTDPVYESLIEKGKDAMPCLVDKITDEMQMPDPREAPPWRHYKVGDTAVFILADIDAQEDVLEKMLPMKYQKEWKTNGVYAYFNYVSKSENRKQLQGWWKAKLKNL